MVEIDMTTVSSKGQIVIPSALRKGMKAGERLLIIHDNGTYILKKADKFDANMATELEFARRTEDAWKNYKKGKFVSKSKEDFLAELKKW